MQSLSLIYSLWPHMLIGVLWMILSLGIGLALGRVRSFFLVHGVHWWVLRVMVPLLYKRFWWLRTITIFVNNMAILIGLILLGTWPYAAVTGIALVGLSMGIALRALSDVPELFATPEDQMCESDRRRCRIGMMLNLLEPPAIIVALGLSLGRTIAPLSHVEIWEIISCWILPAMLLAACGEALWIGVAVRKTNIDIKP